MLSVVGLTVFALVVIGDLVMLGVDMVLWRQGVATITQFATSPGHDLVMAAIVAYQVLGVAGLVVHFLA